MTIAERIYRGETARQLGLSPTEYKSRLETLKRFLAAWPGGDFDRDYRAWLARDAAGDRRAALASTSQPARGLAIFRAGKKRCGKCGGGKIR